MPVIRSNKLRVGSYIFTFGIDIVVLLEVSCPRCRMLVNKPANLGLTSRLAIPTDQQQIG